jgi:hypothetical protein
MIKNEVNIIGVLANSKLQEIAKDNLILKSFNLNITNLEDIHSLYEISLFTEITKNRTITFKDATINSLSFSISTKCLYSDIYTNAIFKENSQPFIIDLDTSKCIEKCLIVDCNFLLDNNTLYLNLLIGFVIETSTIKIYKAKNYIETSNEYIFDSTFDFL